jgi:sulfur carrier protein ThiS adenylyltransferase
MVKQEKFYEKLKKYSVGIAGLGGLGSNAAVSLARAGIGRIVLIDYDTVEKTNLNRQYFFLNQISQNKTDALKENIKKINPEIKIETFTEKLKKNKMAQHFANTDLIIEALDDAETKTLFIEEMQQKLPNTPIIAASGVTGYGNNERIKTKKLDNLYIIYDKKAKSTEKDILTAPRIALIANMQANLAVEILLDKVKK